MAHHYNLCQILHAKGFVTRLNRLGGLPPRRLASMLGLRSERLADGYAIAVLEEKLDVGSVLFGGLTLRSGGREGLPLHDAVADSKRTHNHDKFVGDFGQKFVDDELKKLADDPNNLRGSARIVKFLPVRDASSSDPAVEYPMGGGAPQFILTRDYRFKVAALVDARAVGRTASGVRTDLDDLSKLDGRTKFVQFLQLF